VEIRAVLAKPVDGREEELDLAVRQAERTNGKCFHASLRLAVLGQHKTQNDL
jgi:hypothetical protein